MADPRRPDPLNTDPLDADPLAAELRALGRAVEVPPPPDEVVAAVLARLPDRPPRPSAARRLAAATSGWATRGRRIAVAVLLAVVLALAAGTPAAARIAEWLGLGGIVVVQTPGGGPAPAPGPPADAPPGLTLEEAAARAGFAPAVPSALGAPDRVTVSDDGAVVAMEWEPSAPGAPALRLDQFVGGPAPTFVKRYSDIVEFVAVDGAEALWLARPHTLEYLDATGRERIQPSRTAGPALIWERWPVTLRLEGEPDRDRALAIAASVR